MLSGTRNVSCVSIPSIRPITSTFWGRRISLWADYNDGHRVDPISRPLSRRRADHHGSCSLRLLASLAGKRRRIRQPRSSRTQPDFTIAGWLRLSRILWLRRTGARCGRIAQGWLTGMTATPPTTGLLFRPLGRFAPDHHLFGHMRRFLHDRDLVQLVHFDHAFLEPPRQGSGRSRFGGASFHVTRSPCSVTSRSTGVSTT